MTSSLITLTLDRRLFEHPTGLHLRKMRSALWVYLVVLGRLPAGTGSIDLDPKAVAAEMGLPEGTIRSWLGHLRKGGYLKVTRLNGQVRVSAKTEELPESAGALTSPRKRIFTLRKLVKALGESGSAEALQAALNLYSDDRIRHALAGALAVPEDQIRRSRTALFIYLLKRHDQA